MGGGWTPQLTALNSPLFGHFGAQGIGTHGSHHAWRWAPMAEHPTSPACLHRARQKQGPSPGQGLSEPVHGKGWFPLTRIKMGFARSALAAGAAHPVQQDRSYHCLLLHPVPALPRLPGKWGGHSGVGTPIKCQQASHPGGMFSFLSYYAKQVHCSWCTSGSREHEQHGDAHLSVNILLGSTGREWEPLSGHRLA